MYYKYMMTDKRRNGKDLEGHKHHLKRCYTFIFQDGMREHHKEISKQ
jgi:hypothetical protein